MHSLLVGSLAVFSLLNFDSETLSESWVAHLTAEMAFAYFSTDVVAILIIDDSNISLSYSITCVEYWVHWHVGTGKGLLVSLLSNLLLFFRRYLLDKGKATTWFYLITFTAMILVFFNCRIYLIPLF